MKKLFILAFFILPLVLYAQEKDTRSIVLLKKELHQLKDQRLRVNILLDICREYHELFFYSANKKVDSLRKYAALAKIEAISINKRKALTDAVLFDAFSSIVVKKNLNEKEVVELLENEELNNQQAGSAHQYLGQFYTAKRNLDHSLLHLLKAAKLFNKAGDYRQEVFTNSLISEIYSGKGDYLNGFEYARKALQTGKKILEKDTNPGDWRNILLVKPISIISKYFELGGDYKTAAEYLWMVADEYQETNKAASFYRRLGKIHFADKKYDSSIYYLQKQISIHSSSLKSDPNALVAYMQAKTEIAKCYLKANKINTTLDWSIPLTDTLRILLNHLNLPTANLYLMESLLFSAKALHELQKEEQARKLATEALAILHANKLSYPVVEQHEMLYTLHQVLGQTDSAFFFFKRYKNLQDSLFGQHFLFKLNLTIREAEIGKKQVQMALLESQVLLNEQLLKEQILLKQQKEDELLMVEKDNQLKEQLLKEESLINAQKQANIAHLNTGLLLKGKQLESQVLVTNGSLIGILVLLFIGLMVYRNLLLRRKNQSLELEKTNQKLRLQELELSKSLALYEQQLTQLEMQVLRTQMSPHFMFNCLSSINWLILKKDTDAASDYLNRFSQLIRMVLKYSQYSSINLANEIKMLELYLDMESLRFDHSFQYTIKIPDDLNIHSLTVPPLLLQPFCENAIWHGLLQKEGNRELKIEFVGQEDNLYCTITDNGVGRKKAKELKTVKDHDHQSIGLKVTSERLSIFNEEKNVQTSLEIEDLINVTGDAVGTRVSIRIRNNSYEMKVVV
jgi:hypothetical protein